MDAPNANSHTAFEKLVDRVSAAFGRGATEHAVRGVLSDSRIPKAVADRAIAEARDRMRTAEASARSGVSPTAVDTAVQFLARPVPMPGFLTRSTLFGGRIDLRGYWLGWLYQLPLPLIGLLVYLRLDTASAQKLFGTRWGYGIFLSVILLSVVTHGVLHLSLIIRRMHDMDSYAKSDFLGYYLFGNILLFLGAGDAEPNRYGPPMHSRKPLVVLGLKRAPDASERGSGSA